MKPKWPTSIFEMSDKLVPRLSIYRAKMYAFLVPLVKEPSWRRVNTLGQKEYLAGEVGEKCLMNKLIRIEWVSEWLRAIRLPPKLMDVAHPWAKIDSNHLKSLWNLVGGKLFGSLGEIGFQKLYNLLVMCPGALMSSFIPCKILSF